LATGAVAVDEFLNLQSSRFDGERTALRRPPPLHGEHSEEILAELGYNRDEIETLAQSGTIAPHGPGGIRS
jgi:hypothetical protein